MTPKGNLPVKVCQLLFEQQLIKWQYMEYCSRVIEDEVPFLWPLKQYLLLTGIVKKRHNALSLAKYGEKLLAAPPFDRFKLLFSFFTGHFNWKNFYDINDGGQCGQLGWAYSLLLLARHGKAPLDSEFYSTRNMIAFQKSLYQSGKDLRFDEFISYHRAYGIRFMENFANWFGLIDIDHRKSKQGFFLNQLFVTKSELFDELFLVVTSAQTPANQK